MSLTKHAATALVAAALAGLVTHHLATKPEPAPSAFSSTPKAATSPTSSATSHSADLERLRSENAELRARLAAQHARAAASESALAEQREKLAELRRPLEADLISSTLRATAVQPGEVIVTGGARMPGGKRLYAFAKPVRQQIDGQELVVIESHFLALSDDGTRLLGLDAFNTPAANTLQHGQVWPETDFKDALGKSRSVKDTDLLNSPRITMHPGKEGSVNYGEDGGEMLQLKVAPRLNPDGRTVDIDVRLQLDPGPGS